MSTLGDKFPNFLIAMRNASEGTNTILIKNSSKHVFYTMSLILFGKKAGEITYELDYYDNSVILHICTNKGLLEKAKTSSNFIKEDLSIDEWIELISKMVFQHNYSPKHLEFLNEFNRNKIVGRDKSGCVLMILPLILIAMIIFIYI
ncbi:hypothetical protein [Flavobacterium sp. WC2430]|uniref:hypothetical protein n=1 Tax=Flavobacterium sp. WC2430 TaxID=3234137 RepID=UPI0034668D94